jgi:CMP-N,N'-diacetyllegionaminic acid synthase
MEPVLAVIPARGGSKGIPHKNIRLLNGKPLIGYSIEQAAQAKTLARVLVSTDDEKIAEVAKAWGGDVPFLRPAHLAQDDTPMLPVLQHALEYVEQVDQIQYSAVVILQPTSPLRTADDINRSVNVLLSTGVSTVVTICQVDKLSHPFLVQRLDFQNNNQLSPFLVGPEYEKFMHANRDELPLVVRLNAAVYVVRRDILMYDNKIIGSDVCGVMMELSRSIDIDTEEEFTIAEALIKSRQEEHSQ